MKVIELIETLSQRFHLSEEITFEVNGQAVDPLIDYKGKGGPVIALTEEGEDWELIADGYRACLVDLLEICDESNLTNPKKVEAIRRRLNQEI